MKHKPCFTLTLLLSCSVFACAQTTVRDLPTTDLKVNDVDAVDVQVTGDFTAGTAAVSTLEIGTISVTGTLDIGSAVDFTLQNGDLTLATGTPTFNGGSLKLGGGTWDGTHLEFGTYHLWNNAGELRIKNGAPASATDGAAVGGGGGGGSGDMLAATYDPASIAQQLVGLTAAQTVTNKTFDATNTFTGVMLAADYDAAGIGEQLVGLTAAQTVSNKTFDNTNSFSGVEFGVSSSATPNDTTLGVVQYGTTNDTLYVGNGAGGVEEMVSTEGLQFVEDKAFMGTNSWYGGNISLPSVSSKPSSGVWHDPYWMVMKSDGDAIYTGTNLPTASDVSTFSSDDEPATFTNKTFDASNTWNGGDLFVPTVAGPAQTAQGEMILNYSNLHLTVGTGVAQLSFAPVNITSTLSNKTFDATNTWNGGAFTFPDAFEPMPTAEGEAVWDYNDHVLRVGTGGGTVTIGTDGGAGTVLSHSETITAAEFAVWEYVADIDTSGAVGWRMEISLFLASGKALLYQEYLCRYEGSGSVAFTQLRNELLRATTESISISLAPLTDSLIVGVSHNEVADQDLHVVIDVHPTDASRLTIIDI